MSWLKTFCTTVVVLTVLFTVACGKKKDDDQKARPVAAATTEITVAGQKVTISLDSANVQISGNQYSSTLTAKNTVTKKVESVQLVSTHTGGDDFVNYVQIGSIVVVFQSRCTANCEKFYIVAWSGENYDKLAATALVKGTVGEGFSSALAVEYTDRNNSALAFENILRALDTKYEAEVQATP